MEQYLRKLYYDLNSANSYTSFSAFWKKVKQDKKDKEISKDDLGQWLKQQYTYSLHKPYKKPREYRKTMVPGIEIVEMREFSDFNDGYNYLLCVIDCYSKFAWCQKLKIKTGVEVKKAFEKILNNGRTPDKIQYDKGKKFYNEKVKNLFKDKGIEYFSTDSDKKASIVERFNRTLKTRMWKYFTTHETRRWIDTYDRLVEGYNNTFHRSVSD